MPFSHLSLQSLKHHVIRETLLAQRLFKEHQSDNTAFLTKRQGESWLNSFIHGNKHCISVMKKYILQSSARSFIDKIIHLLMQPYVGVLTIKYSIELNLFVCANCIVIDVTVTLFNAVMPQAPHDGL